MAEQLSWIDADGIEYQLTSTSKWSKLQGWTGRMMPSVSFVENVVPLYPGSYLQNVITKTRDVDIPLVIKGDTPTDLRNNIRELMRALDPNRGDGRLRITGPDGGQRELYCRYSGGLETNEGSDTSYNGYQKVALTFHAFDPYWYGSQTIEETWHIQQVATFFPFFPLRLSSSDVFADTVVTNDGDIEAWPVWIITGPGSDFMLLNMSSNEELSVSLQLGENEQLIIDTSIGKKTVTKSDGTNQYGSMSPDSSLWSLKTGPNSIRVEMTDATTNSSVQLTYRNRYLGA